MQQCSAFDPKALALCMFLGGCVAQHTVAPPVRPHADVPPTSIVVLRRPLAPPALRVPVLAALGQAGGPGGPGAGEEVTRRTPDGGLRTVVEHGG